MFSAEFLSELRTEELSIIDRVLDKSAKILEIGGGTGVQARMLTELGYSVTSIDVPTEGYLADREFAVIEYDGHHIPFEDNSFDIVYSSNVLEHIKHIDEFQYEMHRVLRPGGYSIHAIPTASWRFWTIVTSYHEMLVRISEFIPGTFPRKFHPNELRRIAGQLKVIAQLIKYYAIPPRHGETGNAVSELYSFSRFAWRARFKKSPLTLCSSEPMGIFYTGHMAFGTKLSFVTRRKLAKFLGSACILYISKSLPEREIHE